MNAPSFWKIRNFIAWVLLPLGLFYDLIVRLRFSLTKPQSVEKPVICVGNFTLGGTGKTPTVIHIAEQLKSWGEIPFILSRGYGGNTKGPHRVDLALDHTEAVGDEALLLARAASTIIGGDRRVSARMAIAQGASVLILDDGMQNPALEKNLTLALVDTQSGFGNGFVFPAGPLRAGLNWQKKIADVIINIGAGASTHPATMSASLQPQNADWLKGTRVLAFCGIGNPEKFRTTLQQLGADIVHFQSFPDHYAYDGRDAKMLIERAARDNLTLVTTEKDHVRLQGYEETRAQLAGLANTVAIKFVPDQPEKLDALLKAALSPANGA